MSFLRRPKRRKLSEVFREFVKGTAAFLPFVVERRFEGLNLWED